MEFKGRATEKKLCYLNDIIYYITENESIELAVLHIEILIDAENDIVNIKNNYIDCTMSIEEYRSLTAVEFNKENEDELLREERWINEIINGEDNREKPIRLFDFKNGEWENIIKWSINKEEIGKNVKDIIVM